MMRVGAVASTRTFQQAIQRLQEYWASVGCAVMQCSNTEVGAGTMNPLTFLRVLGPEPWNVALVSCSIKKSARAINNRKLMLCFKHLHPNLKCRLIVRQCFDATTYLLCTHNNTRFNHSFWADFLSASTRLLPSAG